MGHYAAVLSRHGRTEIRLDRFGGYHLFYNLDAGIVSSSFYAICSVLGCLTLLRQSAYEFVFNGVVSGNETLFGEVALAPIGATIRVGAHGLEIIRPALRVTRTFTAETREASLDRSVALLDRYFGAIARSFGDRVGCALSGGYDLRLILAFLRRHGLKPRVYVYGRAGEKDVLLASQIARREGFSLEVIDKDDRPSSRPTSLSTTARLNFLAADSYQYSGHLSERCRDRRIRRGACAATRSPSTVAVAKSFVISFIFSMANIPFVNFCGVFIASLIRPCVPRSSTVRVTTTRSRVR